MEYLKERAALLRVKECDLRLDTLMQCDSSIDRGIHVGGAFSALTCMTALYYGGLMDYCAAHPADTSHDIFILSKGHAVAALAAVYADVGYIERSDLKNSRGYGALIKGHPGPVIPGVPVATGPLGQGISVACGYALTRKEKSRGNVYCMVGDGELQEGSCWEGITLAADRNLANLCIIVDKNSGQSDNTQKLLVSMDHIGEKFKGFGYRVFHVYAEEMEGVLEALEKFVSKPQGAAPTAVICHSYKGFGGRSKITGSHKAVFDKEKLELETENQRRIRSQYIENLNQWNGAVIDKISEEIGLEILRDHEGRITRCKRVIQCRHPVKAEVRTKKLKYDEKKLPILEREKAYHTFSVVKDTIEVLARDPRLYTVDSDLSNASGLYDGVSVVDRRRALNVGIAECNMMCVAEALASEGGNVWTSTFAPFFDQRALRRIAVSYQERQEAIEHGWLSEGHNLDITFLATSANLETAVNGATHMGNDDMNLADKLANVKVIDVSCPQLLQSVMKWIAQGNRGLVYLRTMKTAIQPIYPADFEFSYGKAYYLKKPWNMQIIFISSGHGVTEALKATERLEMKGIHAGVLDMPSEDEQIYRELLDSNLPIIFAEQNNGALADRFGSYLVRKGLCCSTEQIFTVNTRSESGELHYIQSGTYEQLIEAFHLTPEALEAFVVNVLRE